MECLVKQTHRLPRLCFDTQRCALVTAGSDFSADAFVSECRARASLETLLRDLAVFGGAAHAALLDALNTHFAAFNGLSATLTQHTQRLEPVQHSVGELVARIDAWLAALEQLEAQHSELHARAAEATRLRVIAQTLRSALATTQKLERALTAPDTDLERCAHLLSVVAWLCAEPLAGTPLAAALEARHQAARTELLSRASQSFVRAHTTGDTTALTAVLRAYTALDAAAAARRAFSEAVLAPVLKRAAASALVPPLDGAALRRFFALLEPFVQRDCAALAQATPEPHVLFLAALLGDVDALLAARAPGVFAAALPAAFRACYVAAEAFVAGVLRACPNDAARAALRGTEEYARLQKRWNTRLYFQICTQDITAPLELALALPRRKQLIIQADTTGSSSGSHSRGGMRATRVLIHALKCCFTPATTQTPPPSQQTTTSTTPAAALSPAPVEDAAADGAAERVEALFIAPVLQQTARLALQMLARYSSWVAGGASARYAGANASLPVSTLASPAANSSSNAALEEPWASFSVQDFLVPYHDCSLVERFCGTELRALLASCAAAAHPDNTEQQQRVADALGRCVDEACTGLREAQARCEAMFVGTTAHLCCGGLKQMYGIMAAIRVSAASAASAADETAPSHYVAGVLEPLAQLLERAAPLATAEVRLGWARAVCDSVFSKATEICGELVMTAYQTDDMLARMMAAGSAADEQEAAAAATTRRFLAQLTADVQQLGVCAERLGVALDTTPAYQRLCRCLKVM